MNDLHNRLSGHANGQADAAPPAQAKPVDPVGVLFTLANMILNQTTGPGPAALTLHADNLVLTLTRYHRPDVDTESLTTMERKLLSVATPEPMKPVAFARLAGYQMGSHIRRALTELARKGLLLKAAGGGFRLP